MSTPAELRGWTCPRFRNCVRSSSKPSAWGLSLNNAIRGSELDLRIGPSEGDTVARLSEAMECLASRGAHQNGIRCEVFRVSTSPLWRATELFALSLFGWELPGRELFCRSKEQVRILTRPPCSERDNGTVLTRLGKRIWFEVVTALESTLESRLLFMSGRSAAW